MSRHPPDSQKVNALEELQKVREASKFVFELAKAQTKTRSLQRTNGPPLGKPVVAMQALPKVDTPSRVREEVGKYSSQIVAVLKKKFEAKKLKRSEEILEEAQVREEALLAEMRARKGGYDPAEIVF